MWLDFVKFHQYFKWNTFKIIIIVYGLSLSWLTNQVDWRIDFNLESGKPRVEWERNSKIRGRKEQVEVTAWIKSNEFWKLFHFILHIVW